MNPSGLSNSLSDTEGTFRPERIAQIAERFGVDPETGTCLTNDLITAF
jgi:hypothetical protein